MGKEERIALSPYSDLNLLVKQWLKLRKLMKNSDTQDALFLSKKDNAISERVIQDDFKKRVNKAEPLSLEKVTPRSLRHAFASHAMESDCNTLKYFLSHVRLSSTEIYLHLSMIACCQQSSGS